MSRRREQIGNQTGVTNRFAHRTNHNLVALVRRLQESAVRKCDRRPTQRDRHRFRFPLGFRAIAAIDGQTCQTIGFGKIGKGFALLHAFWLANC